MDLHKAISDGYLVIRKEGVHLASHELDGMTIADLVGHDITVGDRPLGITIRGRLSGIECKWGKNTFQFGGLTPTVPAVEYLNRVCDITGYSL